MKKVNIIMLALLVLSATAACKKDDKEKSEANQFTKQETTYKGTATTIVEYWDYDLYSGDYFVGEKTYTYPVFIFTGASLSVDGVNESNPFNLQIYPDRDNSSNEEGHMDMSSCTILNDIYVGKVILQYWDFGLNGNSISGNLSNTHIAEAAANNLIWCLDDIAGIEMCMPFPMAVGTKMQGNIDNEKVILDLSGESTNTYRKFSCHIEAVRK